MRVGTRRDVVSFALAAFFITDTVLAGVIGGIVGNGSDRNDLDVVFPDRLKRRF